MSVDSFVTDILFAVASRGAEPVLLSHLIIDGRRGVCMVRVGGGELVYEVAEGWGALPQGWAFGQVAGVAIDSKDRVYVFNRSSHPVMVFDRNGDFLKSWGEGVFSSRTHGIYIDEHDNVFCSDDGDHTVRKLTLDGKLLMTLGTPNKVGEEGVPFNRPTYAVVAPSGEIFVSDGYGNSRVHKFSHDGGLLKSWGTKGEGPGQFNIPHGVWVMDGKVYVADRQNHRIQIFTMDGEYITEWKDFQQPCTIYVDKKGLMYVPELRSRMSILNKNGELLARWGGEKSREPGQFIAPHGAWVDSHGDLYVGEVLEGQRLQKFVRV